MAMTKKPYDLTVSEAATALAEGELSPVQLVGGCLERIEAVEGSIQAWALVDGEGALEAAHRLEQELRRGQRRGPLHGIPVGVKDIFYTAGLQTEAGSQSWSGFVPAYDAAVVTRLKEAGAIILGKTHTAEFAFLDPAPTRNPWNTAHTPGGSSSGSGAAVAAGMCPVALGSQTAGSTLRPAAYNGIVGFKPQHGRISTYGVVPLSWTMDHVGILARTVEDAALVFQAVAGHDPRDTYSLSQPVPDCLAFLDGQGTPRLGLVRQHFFDRADEEMRRHTEGVVERLRQAGAEVEEVALPPSLAAIFDTSRTIMWVEAATYHQEMFAEHKDQYGLRMRKMLEEGLAIPAIGYARALQARLQQRADIEPLLSRVDGPAYPGGSWCRAPGPDHHRKLRDADPLVGYGITRHQLAHGFGSGGPSPGHSASWGSPGRGPSAECGTVVRTGSRCAATATSGLARWTFQDYMSLFQPSQGRLYLTVHFEANLLPLFTLYNIVIRDLLV